MKVTKDSSNDASIRKKMVVQQRSPQHMAKNHKIYVNQSPLQNRIQESNIQPSDLILITLPRSDNILQGIIEYSNL